MKPEQLIAELEAALHQGESHDWRLLAPLVLDALKAMQAAVDRATVGRDEAEARNAFLHNETGKALEIIASRIELNPPISAEEQSDIEAVARWVKAIGAEQVARLMQERDEARAELAKAGESIRAYERMIDGVAEKASALACEQVKAEFLRRDTLARLQAAEIEALKSELARLTTPRPSEPLEMDCGDNSCLFAKTRGGMRTNGGCRCLENLGFHRGERESLRRMAAEVVSLRKRVSDLTTPRPIEEAPKDGTWIVGLWPQIPDAVPVIACWTNGEWRDETGETFNATHFLPLPVKP